MHELWADFIALPWFLSLLIVLAIVGLVIFILSKDKLLRRRNMADRRQVTQSTGIADERRCGGDRRQ